MNDDGFDKALVAAIFEQAGLTGWKRLSVAEAARAAGLDLARARLHVPSRQAALLRFGRLADAAALTGAVADGPARDRLFDILMRRIDVLQAHRSGTLALLRWLPTEPGIALMLAALTRSSMGWMLEGAGISAQGLRGAARTRALLGVWVWTLRAWQRDESVDLSPTMASLDSALRRVEQAALMCSGRRAAPSTGEAAPPTAEPGPEPPPPPMPTPPPAPGPAGGTFAAPLPEPPIVPPALPPQD